MVAFVFDHAARMRHDAMESFELLRVTADRTRVRALHEASRVHGLVSIYAAEAAAMATSTWRHLQTTLAEGYDIVRTSGLRAFIVDVAANAGAIAQDQYRAAAQYMSVNVTFARTRVGENIEYYRRRAGEAVCRAQGKVVNASNVAKQIALDPKMQVTAASATTGAVALGASGAATGVVTGGVMGAAIGVVPAIFTFGLSVPLGALLGAGAGLFSGAVVGSSVGFVSGGAAGYSAYVRKDEIRSGLTNSMQFAKNSVCMSADFVSEKASASAELVKGGALLAKAKASASVGHVRAKLAGAAGA